MIVSFRCSPKLKQQIDALIAAGLYPDFSTFCTVALENQLLLEESHGVARGKDVAGRPLEQTDQTSKRAKKGKNGRAQDKRRALFSVPGPSTLSATEKDHGNTADNHRIEIISPSPIPLELNLARLDDRPPFPLPSTFTDMFQDDQIIPIDRWLFGQYNRLLPAKVSIRGLAVVSNEGKDALLLESVAPRIAEVAAKFGDYLRSLDRRFANHRDDALATAFPDASAEGQKGRVRYQNHFVGYTAKGEQGGMLVGLKLAVIQVIRNKPHILPTIVGWDFARLANPVLDAPVSQTLPRLSSEEIAFLLRHIKEHVPTELFAYRAVLSLISEGKGTPESVNQGLARYLSPGKKLEEEQDFISTQKNGVLGRMSDLGLVNRERQGTRITYHITPEGEKFLSEVGSITAVAGMGGGGSTNV